MAVVAMERIQICGLKKERKPILEAMQRLGAVELCDTPEDEAVFKKVDVSEPASYLSRHRQMALQALEILDQYAPQKKSMFAALLGKTAVTADRYDDFVNLKQEAKLTARKIVNLSKSMHENKAEIIKLRLQQEALEPWKDLDVPLNFSGTKSTSAFIGVLPGTWDQSRIYEAFAEVVPLESEIFSVVKEQTFLFLLCLKKHAPQMLELLRINGFSKPGVQSVLPPSQQFEQYDKEAAALEAEISKAQAELKSLSEKRELISFYADYEAIREEKYSVISRLWQSNHIFLLTGYIPKRDSQRLKAFLESKYTVDIQLFSPGEDEDVPVLLANNGFVGSLEGITESFSPPGKGEMDPTGIMSVFYYMLFGIMLSDAGYGAIMALACGLILLKFKNIEPSLRRSVKMFFFCGLSTVFWGIMFSSYFGDVVDVVSATFFGKAVTVPPVWFSPTAEPMRMLVFSMILGLIHLFAGLGMKLYQCIKNGDTLGGIYDSVFWIVLLVSSVVLLMSSSLFMEIVGAGFTVSKMAGNIAAVIALAASVGIVATNGRESRNPFKRFLKGAYALYGITGYLSDVLSYSRLLALGLATGVIGTVINKMGAMTNNAVIFIVVFLLGHALNMAINVLGAYVHTNRLQYVEFFGKFYEGGGRKFEPFSNKTKFYKIEEN
ncbi:V-type ATP synthase subunit I [Oscillospiraceae bacterium MB08-C2-2]|nr:V-type ATP synthase subunit I [Oscillospiraceae bacterium MB08-C2-2]